MPIEPAVNLWCIWIATELASTYIWLLVLALYIRSGRSGVAGFFSDPLPSPLKMQEPYDLNAPLPQALLSIFKWHLTLFTVPYMLTQ